MVWLKVLEASVAGVAAYRKAGFRSAGRLRQAGWWLGRPCDEILMAATADDFLDATEFT
jgi:RimJ/RimL family protein N-acetyltransferase